MKKIFASVPFIVDVDDSIGEPRPRLRISIDQDRLEFFGVEQSDVYDTIQTLLGGVPVGYSHRGEDRNPIEISVRLPEARPRLDRGAGLDAGPRQYAARQQDRGRARRRRPRHPGGRLADDLPPRRPLRRHGDGRSRRHLRGADLRHARGRARASTRTTGAPCPSRSSACTVSRRTSRSRRCCGTASGRSPT